MTKTNILWISTLLLMLVGCSSDDDNIIVNNNLIVGKWEASHQSKNPAYGDTADMWQFTLNADGTGSGPFMMESFRYEIEGEHITLRLTNTTAYFGQVVFEYKIVSFTNDRMEWNQIPDDYGQHLIFYRKQ